MRTMKERGLEELRSLRRRLRRLYGLGRIARPDYMYIDARLDEVEARIVQMRETNEYGREVG
jgi:hypothetical protein